MTAADSRHPTAGALHARLRTTLAGLPSGESRVLGVLLDHGSVLTLTVSEVAASAGVGVGTVVRACQTVGFKGFQDAKISLAQDVGPIATGVQRDVRPSDSAFAVLDKLAASSGTALRQASTTVTAEALDAAVRLLHAADRIVFLAVGTSAPLAQDAAYRFTTIGLQADAPTDVHAQHVQARLMRPGQVAVAVSHTGATNETVSAATAARSAGADVVAVTSFASTPLTEVSTVSLVAGSRETEFRVEAMASRFAHLLLLDTVYVALYLAHPDRARDAQDLMAEVLAEHRF